MIEKKITKLEAEILAIPKPEISWYKNGKILENDDRIQSHDAKGGVYQLTIKNSRKEDTGTYTCKAINVIGEAECKAQLAIDMPPLFLKKLEKLEAVESCQAHWFFQLIGLPKPKVDFIKNNKEITMDNINYSLIEKEDNIYCLTIHNVNKYDVGTWTCTVSNTAGTTSCIAKLETLPLTPPKFIKELFDCNLAQNVENKLEIHASGIPYPNIEWFKDGILIDFNKSQKYKIDKDMETGAVYLIIKDCKVDDDSGLYTARAVNPGGECSCNAKITIKGFFLLIVIILY